MLQLASDFSRTRRVESHAGEEQLACRRAPDFREHERRDHRRQDTQLHFREPEDRILRGDDGLVELAAAGAAWQPRLWVELATQVFTDGITQALVGTRALLGEGWDAPCVNCLVDLSAATTSVSVTQMRGRSLRLDPDDPDKIASNWDIVAVAPELARGTADYGRFVRKHLHLFAPSEDGAIEAGPSHVHPSLGPFAPPAEREFDEINRTMTRRAAQHATAPARPPLPKDLAMHRRRRRSAVLWRVLRRQLPLSWRWW